ncbi:hypothetical protein P7C73_g3618, partial [Tremellales sp. Uapishka_1]
MSTSTTSPPELPWAFIDCSIDALVVLISHMLNLLIQHNDQVDLTPDMLTRFHSRAPPQISVHDYLTRIVRYTGVEKIPLLSLLAYIDLTCVSIPSFTLSSLTVHRFLIAGICAGAKAQCDAFCTNAFYAKVGGLKIRELNDLEREFLRVTNWDLCCTSDLLQTYYTNLIKNHGGFVQAPPPDQSPFLAFPLSTSKPSSPAGSTSDLDDSASEDDDLDSDADLDGPIEPKPPEEPEAKSQPLPHFSPPIRYAPPSTSPTVTPRIRTRDEMILAHEGKRRKDGPAVAL